jgi:hypothetical protein
MSLRVDFLMDSEKRFQGRVGNRFIAVSAAATAVAIFVLFVGFQVLAYRQLKGDIQKADATLAIMLPREEIVKRVRAETARWKRMEAELDGWRNTRTPVSGVLHQVQQAMSENMQILQMTLRDDLTVPARSGKETQPEPRRVFRIRIEGRAVGLTGEQDVSRFIQRLNAPEEGAPPPFQSVTLLSIQSEGQGEGASSLFEIEAAGPERMLK